MQVVHMPPVGVVESWRAAARALASQGVASSDVRWSTEEDAPDLFDATITGPMSIGVGRTLAVPRPFLDLIGGVLFHDDPQRFARLYDLLLRLQDDARLLKDLTDPSVAHLFAMQKSVRRDMHKMTAFLRFREVEASGPRRNFVAWFEPDHFITEPCAPFFARRFGDMDWLIATPHLCARLEAGRLGFAPGIAKPADAQDPAEALWQTYYRNIFNPARLKPKAMQSEMPKKYWRNLPEATLIPDMIAGAENRVREMRENMATEPPLRSRRILAQARRDEAAPPGGNSLEDLRDAARSCTRCPLYADATSVVFGEGPTDAELMFVGEQPGDEEDLAGRPFVGPAGRLFDRTLREAGIDRNAVYVTNAVKHFKFKIRGKRRLHQRPNGGEVMQCRWWLDAERNRVRPKLLVALGATAALALTDDGKNILKRRGTVEATPQGGPVFLTIHPSYLLRLPDAALKASETEAFRRDLQDAAAHAARLEITPG